ncbi:MAG: ribosome biogenesis GTPase YlqF [Bacteroides sp.]|nr:ribosome biogenesis GTPase YlqF [Bacillota bacterium]MCM1393707.1 ribosome biogenesis GTPase YlqF [[Eubacterium] siraeum]MCM1456081.1 ribosome biogenesis GTPase YlqF [Bacteroides sp.]
MNIQWFPGHMTKAIRMMEDNLRLVDALIYVIDARAVSSCINPLFTRLLNGKKVLYVFNKCDLVEPRDLSEWCDEFKRQGKNFVKAVGTSGDCSQIVAGLKAVMSEKLDKYAKKGANISVRAMVVGVPNSGKSTIINSMIKRAKAVTGDRPGVTRGKQWLSIDGVDFLDTPGTLWGKFEDQKVAHHLAYIGSIKDDILDSLELACDFVDEIKTIAPEGLTARYGLKGVDGSAYEIIEEIAARRGFKLRADNLDVDRASKTVIDDFRKGRLGKIMLERR